MAPKPTKLGRQAEAIASQHLQKKGYQLITTNFHSRFGEIDLILLDQETLVFVEVKARRKGSQVLPEESVTPVKLDRITTTAQIFMQKHPDLPSVGRIDVITLDDTGSVLRHLKDVSNN